MCLSTWVGFAVTTILILSGNATPFTTNNAILTIFLHGLLSTGGVWLIHTIQEAVERAFNK
jgi:hypothetical protein